MARQRSGHSITLLFLCYVLYATLVLLTKQDEMIRSFVSPSQAKRVTSNFVLTLAFQVRLSYQIAVDGKIIRCTRSTYRATPTKIQPGKVEGR